MRTLIELYDERPLENVLGALMFRPETVVVLCPGAVLNGGTFQKVIRNYLSYRGVDTAVELVYADMYNASAIVSCLTEVTDRHEDCVLDITGGTDNALFAAGVLCATRDVPAITYSRRLNRYFSINKAPFGNELPCELHFTAEDCFLMAGGSVREGRVDNSVLDKYMGFFKPFFDVYMRRRTDWTATVNYMQAVSGAVNGKICLDVDAPLSVKSRRGTNTVKPAILEDFRRMGFLKDLRVEGGRVHFRFRDEQVRFWLRDIGSVLETYVYKLCLDSGAFDDVATSVIVDWEGEKTAASVSNELDVVVTKGIVPIFISCKTCEIKTEALNELAVLRDRFGAGIARAVIVSTSKCQTVNRHRAAELGITVFDLEDIRAGRMEKAIKQGLKGQ